MADKSEYYAKQKKSRIWMVIIFAIVAVIAIYSICVTQYQISFSRAIEIIINRLNNVVPEDYWDRLEDRIVINYLMPRAIGCVTVGLILGVCGAIMQSIIRNPLADPYTTGISSGALLGVTLFVVLDISLIPTGDSDIGMVLSAFVFALIPCFLVIALSTFKKITSTTMVLIGIAVMYVFNAISTLIRYTATEDDIAAIYSWAVGVMGKMNWEASVYLVIASIGLMVVSLYLYRVLDVLSMDDRLCTALGENPQKMRLVFLIIVAIATATAVCFVGTIGFVGLIAPHIARIFVGSNSRHLIPASAAIGALILVAADSVSRVVITTGLPVGIITSLIGGPIFLFILLRQRKSAWGKM